MSRDELVFRRYLLYPWARLGLARGLVMCVNVTKVALYRNSFILWIGDSVQVSKSLSLDHNSLDHRRQSGRRHCNRTQCRQFEFEGAALPAP